MVKRKISLKQFCLRSKNSRINHTLLRYCDEEDIKTIAQLCNLSRFDLVRKIKNFGANSSISLERELKEIGWKLKKETKAERLYKDWLQEKENERLRTKRNLGLTFYYAQQEINPARVFLPPTPYEDARKLAEFVERNVKKQEERNRIAKID